MEKKKIEQYTVLIVDDDVDFAMIMKDVLEDNGYKVVLAKNAAETYEVLAKCAVHLILLDINLPDELGFDICKEIRKQSTVPIIFASARTSEDDRVVGLDIGGDDYLSKPYSIKEMLSHVNAIIRRTYGFQKNAGNIQFGQIEIDFASRIVKKSGKEISLSLKEYEVLAYLAKHVNETVRKEELLSSVWGIYSEMEISTVAVHLRWLREKLEEDPAHPMYLKTVWGVGYILQV